MEWLDRIVNKLALPAIVAALILVPAGAWYYETVHIPSQYPADAKVFTIWFSGTQGLTLDKITAYNYWLKQIDRLEDITVEKGDRVILRLISSDAYHGFTLPEFGIKEVVVKPGEVSEVEFVADKTGSFLFFCTIQCGPIHPNMRANLTVVEPQMAGYAPRNDGDRVRPERGGARVGVRTVGNLEIALYAWGPQEIILHPTEGTHHKPREAATHHLDVTVYDLGRKEYVPYLNVKATVTDLTTKRELIVELVPMIGEWLHYGANITLPQPGTYSILVDVQPPDIARFKRLANVWNTPGEAVFTYNYRKNGALAQGRETSGVGESIK
ncbi:MAG: iron transporter [Candidatus Methylomirabilales bacterium]